MAKITPPSGFRDFLPDQYRRRSQLVARIRRVYESFGFEGMETPALENLAVFLGKGGAENEKLMFQVLKRGVELTRALERGSEPGTPTAPRELADLALRFDLTVPLARYYASHRAELPAIFKRYQIGPVWRAERPQHGRFREFTQCDIDVLGSSSPMVEAEVMMASAAVFHELGFENLVFRLNSRPLLDALVKSFGVPASHVNAAFVSIDKLDKLSRDEVAEELVQKGVTSDVAQAMLAFHAEVATREAPLDEVEARVGEEGKAFATQVRSVIALAPPLASGKLVFDPFLARGMDYYTGPVFEVGAPLVPFSLAGGGRFDQLIERLGGPSVPACGFSIGFERVYTIMEERNMFGASARAADALVAVPSSDACAFALLVGHELRSQGLSIDVFPGAAKLGSQYELAERKGIPLAIVADPLAEALQVRVLQTRENINVARDQLAAWIRHRSVMV